MSILVPIEDPGMAHEGECCCTVDEMLDRYLAAPGFSAKTRVDYTSNLTPVREVLGARPVTSIRDADVEALIARMAASVKTNGPGKGGPVSARSISLTVGRLRAALAAHNGAAARARGFQVYVIGAEGSPLVKIGRAVDVPHRLQNLQSGSPVKLTLLGVFSGPDGRALEHSLHVELAAARRHGEWFDLGPDPLAVVNALVLAA